MKNHYHMVIARRTKTVPMYRMFATARKRLTPLLI